MDGLAAFIQKQNRRGFAVGKADIRTDSIDFTYWSEKYNFPALRVIGMCEVDEGFYLARIAKLRKLAKENGAKH